MKYALVLLVVVLTFSCQPQPDFKTNKKDYDSFLTSESVITTSKQFELWNSKIKSDSLQSLALRNVAQEYNRFFQATGEIEYLKKAEQALQKALETAAIGKTGYHRTLARNYISQHRFKEALELAESARQFGSGVNASQSLLFDVHMELGNYNKAERYLDSIKNMSDFGYLIRLAKWNDYKGDLETAIHFMEKAREKAESSKNRGLLLWSYTNLADFYGHAGRIEDSYTYYLKALEIDPKNAYAKKGLAWIVYSHEKNGTEALRIVNSILETYQSPELYLLKGEIAEFIGDEELKVEALDDYYNLVENSSYGVMYNAHNVDFYVNELQQVDKALSLAWQEVKQRPTPESYSLLAYSLLKLGEKEQALQVINDQVAGKTFVPSVLQHMAEIYKANGIEEEVSALKQELLGALYELGPNSEPKILNL